MITDQLIAMLEKHAEVLADSWIQMLKENENITFYSALDETTLTERSRFIYDQLKRWLEWQATSKEIARCFWDIGKDRQQQGIALSEVLYSLILARRNLYINILEKLEDEEGLSMQELIAFTSRVTYFFDKATYFITKGYEGTGEPAPDDESVLDRMLSAFRSGTSLNK